MSEVPTSQSPKSGGSAPLQYFLSALFGNGTETSSTSTLSTLNTTTVEAKSIDNKAAEKSLTNTQPYHICGLRTRKTRMDILSLTGNSRSSIVTTINYPLKEKNEENTVGALKKEISEELNIPIGCEMKLFYGGAELENDSHLLSLYVLQQERDILLEPHIVIALKEGKIVKPVPVEEKKEEEKKEEKKEEEKKEEKKEEEEKKEATTTTTSTTTTVPVSNTLDDAFPELTAMLNRKLGRAQPPPPPVPTTLESKLKAYEEFEIKFIKAKDPVHLEECEDCYVLPGCNHGICGDSLYHYAWNSVKDKKECWVRCPHVSEDPNENGKICAKAIEFPVVKKILSHFFKKSKDKTDAFSNSLDMMFALEVMLCENYLHEHYDAQKCKACSSVLYRQLKPDRTASIQFKSFCPVCSSDKEWEHEEDKKKKPKVEKRRSSVFDRIFCSTSTSEKVEDTTTKEQKDVKETPKETPKEATTDTLPTTTTQDQIPLVQPNVPLVPPPVPTLVSPSPDSTVKKEEVKAPEPSPPKIEISPFDFVFCWSCGSKWKDIAADFCGISDCQTHTRAEVITLLQSCGTKKIGQVDGVPEIRGCPTCGQMVSHTEACKHMTCRCTAAFCFVCMKPKLKTGNWQCGASSDVCPVSKRQTHEDLPAGNRSVVNLFHVDKK